MAWFTYSYDFYAFMRDIEQSINASPVPRLVRVEGVHFNWSDAYDQAVQCAAGDYFKNGLGYSVGVFPLCHDAEYLA